MLVVCVGVVVLVVVVVCCCCRCVWICWVCCWMFWCVFLLRLVCFDSCFVVVWLLCSIV